MLTFNSISNTSSEDPPTNTGKSDKRFNVLDEPIFENG